MSMRMRMDGEIRDWALNPEKYFQAKLPNLYFQQSARQGQCRSDGVLTSLLEDLFMGHELIPDVLDNPPLYPLELTYKTIRTYPGMKLTADLTRFKPMLHWPSNRNSIYTVVMSNLDINNRKNR